MLDTGAFPAGQISLVDAASSPVACVRWAKPVDAGASSLRLLSGAVLPIADGVRPVELMSGGGANRAVLQPGVGYFVQTVGQEPASPSAGSPFWISDTGMRFGIDGGTSPDGAAKTIAALGLNGPAIGAPWSVLSLFVPGPALSTADALTVYTGTENR